MNFGLRQKFSFLAFFAGAMVAFVSIIGYYTSYNNLSETLAREVSATVEVQGQELNSWVLSKAKSAEYVANLLGNLGSLDRMKNRELLSLTTSDKDILDVTIGLQDKYIFGYQAGDFTGKIDPTVRQWYNAAKDADKLTFSDAYVDGFTGKLIVSAVAPIKINGQFAGSTCVDLSLDVLTEQVKKMKYRGEGDGIIFERNGNLLATSTDRGVKTVQEIPGIGEHFNEMVTNATGYFTLPAEGQFGSRVFAYTTLESSGWILGIAVDEGFVFAATRSMRTTYLLLTIVGFIIMILACLKLSASITNPIAHLQQNAVQLSKGNLQIDNINIDTQDEIGTLAAAFNDMRISLRDLIGKMLNTSQQVAASSQELTASAQQSADTSVHVAENVNEVSNNMSHQLEDVEEAKKNVDVVFADIEKMSEKTRIVTETSNETADAALRGSQLMEVAVQKMSNIETSVNTSAEVVKKLGENSQQIGQIVEAISAIAEQTNLLALNAAIEAARAGEHGRGFAVVAEEVRKLASESQTSAEQIRDRILSIQNDTENAVESMQGGTKDVKEGTAAINEVGEQFKRIMKHVDDIKQQMQGIGSSMKTVSDGASGIVTAINSIDDASRKNSNYTNSISTDAETQSASSQEIAAASQALSHLAEEMQSAINKFKI